MKKQHTIIKGTLYLTIAGFISRIIGFFYRIFLSHTIGAEGMGIYQLIFPIYILCFSLTVSGIHTGISRFTSAQMASNNKNGALKVLLAGLILAVLPSIFVSYLIYSNASYIAYHFLNEVRCIDLLKIISLSVPFGAIHTCINGYYYGIKKAEIPAISQLIEQIVRVLSVYVIYLVLMEKGLPITPAIAAIGIVIGEIASVLFTTTFILMQTNLPLTFKIVNRIPLTYFKNIFTLSLPLTANRVVITLLQSIEAVLIPIQLRKYGLSSSNSLSIYGILTGMSLPLILFPSTFTNSLSVMLLPDVAEAQASSNMNRIRHTSKVTIQYCLILGILCTGIFLSFGYDIGNIIFNNNLSGEFIITLAWICPFLYLSTTLNSILHGLGKTTTTFIHSLLSILIRILFIVLCVPRFGIQGYLWGLLIGQLVMTLLNYIVLNKYIPITISLYTWIVKPVEILCIAICFGVYTNILLNKLPFSFDLLNVTISCACTTVIYLVMLNWIKLFPVRNTQ
ncbi:stage V sporulation protein B [Lachnotalea glycerini]|uniref:Stage V sporulation protein B n=1 Tax=Lachnotalea glycerini TaxID=1763509 RepID=A0A318EY72_9FIRM|nr:polysaccharide biosynthesis protein [Lachnotalea glycerini]PXV95994.1 stage V sporulation protein B [Lachnotalea glycerini]